LNTCVHMWVRVRFMVFNATFTNISVLSWSLILLVEETRLHGDSIFHLLLNYWVKLLDPEFTEKTSVHQYIPGKPYHICSLRHACWWFSPCNLVSSTNKIKLHDNTEILVKVALNTINLTLTHICTHVFKCYPLSPHA
jgi:hypothetical protein